MTRVRLLFILQRTCGYLSILMAIWWFQPRHVWWVWLTALGCAIWGSLDQWKRPNEVAGVMRRGVWAEVLVIFGLILLFRDPLPLFLCISPLARSCIHLGWYDASSVGMIAMLGIIGFHVWLHPALWLEITQFVTLLGTMVYAGVIGELVRERDRLRKLVALDAAERERRIKVEERLRMATHLHDTQGQAWTAVLRSIDVAMRVDGEQQQVFLQRARDAAHTGLQQMRAATHDWYESRLTPIGYIEDALKAIHRMETLTDVKMHLSIGEINWDQIEASTRVAELVARALVEASTNAIRHGESKDVWVQLQSDPQALYLIVRDNGNGLVRNSGISTGIGLSSLTREAQNLGGSLTVEGKPGIGTHVVLQIPNST